MSEPAAADYEVVIEPHRQWLYIDWKGLFQYRDLLLLLVQRELISKYKQTALGPLWFVIQPLLTAMTFWLVFAKFARLSTDSVPPPLFYLCGLLPWSYFAQSLTSISASFLANANLFEKVYFPRLVIPLAAVLSHLAAFVLQLGVFLAFFAYYKWLTPAGAALHPNLHLLGLPLLLLLTALVSLGAGLWIAALTTKYRDFQHLVPLLLQLWMFATPLIYPASSVPERWRWALALNPLCGIVEAYRHAFFGSGAVSGAQLLLSSAGVVALLVSGVILFAKVERTFVDTI